MDTPRALPPSSQTLPLTLPSQRGITVTVTVTVTVTHPRSHGHSQHHTHVRLNPTIRTPTTTTTTTTTATTTTTTTTTTVTLPHAHTHTLHPVARKGKPALHCTALAHILGWGVAVLILAVRKNRAVQKLQVRGLWVVQGHCRLHLMHRAATHQGNEEPLRINPID